MISGDVPSEDRIDMIDEVAEMKRFGQHLGVLHLLPRTHGEGGETGNEQDLQIGVYLVSLTRDLNPGITISAISRS